MYDIFEKLCEEKGVTMAEVSRATGVAKATLSEWKKGTYRPKAEKLQKIADYFGVTLKYLLTGQHPGVTSESGKTYYFNDETAEAAQEMYENERLRALFRNQRKMSPEDLAVVEAMVEAMLRKEQQID